MGVMDVIVEVDPDSQHPNIFARTARRLMAGEAYLPKEG
jgi:2-methylaconitate cis-trans-isomerase PrpF